MSIVVCRKTRRQFLVGAGNTLLALPFLPSLFTSSQALAQATAANRRLMLFWFDHAIAEERWPNRNIATTPVGNIGAREMMLSSLPNISALSPYLNNPLYDTLRRSNQMTMVRGLEILGPGGHGVYPLGGNVDFDGGRIIQGSYSLPTLDSIMESSASLYPASTPSNVIKALRVTLQHGTGNYYQKVGGLIQALPSYGPSDTYGAPNSRSTELVRMYNEVFASLTNGTTNPVDSTNLSKTNILNRVFSSYSSFRTNRRISSEDQARVDQHLGMIADLQRRFASTMPVTNSCARPTAPLSSIADPTVSVPIYMNLMALAFKCNLTKFGVMYFDSHDPQWIPGLNLGGLGVHAGFHGDGGSTIKTNCYTSYHTWNNNQIANHFLAHLNEPEGNTGRTYLDNMATVLLSQMGYESLSGGSGHSSYDLHQILIGSMGGAIRAGRYVSYPAGGLTPRAYDRLMPNNCFHITLLQLMGVPESEYGVFNPNRRGFGYYPTSSTGNAYASRFYSPLTEILT